MFGDFAHKSGHLSLFWGVVVVVMFYSFTVTVIGIVFLISFEIALCYGIETQVNFVC